MAALPLTIEAICLYGRLYGYNDEMRYFFRLMAGLDDEFLSYQSDKAKSEKDAAASEKEAARRNRSK